MKVVVVCIRPYVGGLDDRQAWDVRQRPRMPCKVVENLLLAEEDRRIVRMGFTPKLNAEEAPIDLITNVLRWHVALGKKSEAEADPSRFEVLARYAGPTLDVILSLPLSLRVSFRVRLTLIVQISLHGCPFKFERT